MIDGGKMREQIKGFIMRSSGAARKRRIGDDEHLLESGILDSLGVLDLLSFIEREFSVSLVDDELVPENFQTVARLASFVEWKVGERTRSS